MCKRLHPLKRSCSLQLKHSKLNPVSAVLTTHRLSITRVGRVLCGWVQGTLMLTLSLLFFSGTHLNISLSFTFRKKDLLQSSWNWPFKSISNTEILWLQGKQHLWGVEMSQASVTKDPGHQQQGCVFPESRTWEIWGESVHSTSVFRVVKEVTSQAGPLSLALSGLFLYCQCVPSVGVCAPVPSSYRTPVLVD